MSEKPASPAEDRGVTNHLSHTLIHNLLVFSEKLSFLPDVLVIASLILNALVVGVIWAGTLDPSTGMVAGAIMLLLGGINGLILCQLPVRGMSWGSPKPPLLALSAAQALILSVLGVFAAPLAAAVLLPVIMTVLAFYSTWIEPFRVGVTRQTLDVGTGTGKSIRVLHLSDLHIERVSPREREVNRLIRSLQPDLILFSGDFVNITYTYDKRAAAAIREVIGDWHAPLGVFAVPGTPHVEPLERVAAFTNGLPNLSLMLNRWQTITSENGVIHLLGLVTTHKLEQDRAALADALKNAPTSPGMRVLLTHSPDLAPEAAAAGFHLYLCGHTHGGQIRLPLVGAVLTASHYGRRFVMGCYKLDKMILYVTRGLGMEGFGAPRARFLCPPELVLWEINV